MKTTGKKNVKKKVMKKSMCMLTGIAFMVMCNTVMVLADNSASTTSTGVDQIDNILSGLKTILIAIVSGIGIIMAIPKVGEFSEAFQQKDNHGMWDSGKGLIGCSFMIFVGPVLTLLGII
ncbi:MAG: hypothetical protein ACI4AD_05670 [Roseburia sp.]